MYVSTILIIDFISLIREHSAENIEKIGVCYCSVGCELVPPDIGILNISNSNFDGIPFLLTACISFCNIDMSTKYRMKMTIEQGKEHLRFKLSRCISYILVHVTLPDEPFMFLHCVTISRMIKMEIWHKISQVSEFKRVEMMISCLRPC